MYCSQKQQHKQIKPIYNSSQLQHFQFQISVQGNPNTTPSSLNRTKTSLVQLEIKSKLNLSSKSSQTLRIEYPSLTNPFSPFHFLISSLISTATETSSQSLEFLGSELNSSFHPLSRSDSISSSIFSCFNCTHQQQNQFVTNPYMFFLFFNCNYSCNPNFTNFFIRSYRIIKTSPDPPVFPSDF